VPDAGRLRYPIQLEVERTQQIGGGTVRFHALVWSPLTAGLKRQLDVDNTGTPTDCTAAGACKPKRAWLNGHVKDNLLNDCLADAVIYQGESHVAIRDAMVESISRISRTIRQATAPWPWSRKAWAARCCSMP
jgi:hypothetical protein